MVLGKILYQIIYQKAAICNHPSSYLVVSDPIETFLSLVRSPIANKTTL